MIPVTTEIPQPVKLSIVRLRQAEKKAYMTGNLQQIKMLLGNEPSDGDPPLRRISPTPAMSRERAQHENQTGSKYNSQHRKTDGCHA